MRQFKVLSPLLMSLVFVGSAISNAGQATTDAAKAEENAANAYIVQKVLASISRSGCDFQFKGSTNQGQANIDFLDVDCMIQLTDKQDLNISLLDTQGEGTKEDQSLKTVVNIKSKGIYLRLLGSKESGDARLTAQFFSKYDKTSKKWIASPLEVSVAVYNGKQVMNSELVAIRLGGIDLKIKENPQNSRELTVSGTCDAQKKIYNFIDNTVQYRTANCVLAGLYEPNKTSKFNFEFTNAKINTAKP